MAANPLTKNPKIKFPRLILFSFFIFTAGILILGRVYYRSQIIRINKNAQESLTAISLLKIDQIEQWHIERLANANQVIYNNPLLKSLEQYINSKKQPETEADIKKWTKYMSERLDFNGVFIYDTLLNLRLATTQTDSVLSSTTKIIYGEVLKDMKVRMTDLYRNISTGQPTIDLLIPLVLNNKNHSPPFGVIILRIDPTKSLFPLIQLWPTSSRSAETLIIRKEGDSVLYLNDLRHIQNTALNLRIPLADKNLLASKAVNGFIGVVEGIDYKMNPVVGYVTSLPGLNWFMVAKIDKEEIQAPLKRISFISVSVTLILVLFVASVLLFWIRNQQFIQSREQLRNELGRKQLDEALIISEARYRILFENIGDAVMISELLENGKIGKFIQVNDTACKRLGYSREELLMKSPLEINSEKSRQIVNPKIKNIIEEKHAIVEAEHVTKDGRIIPVEISTSITQLNNKTIFLSIARDISERKLAEEKLRETNEYLSNLFNYANAPIIVWDTSLLITQFNHAFENLSGYFEEEVLGKKIDILFPAVKAGSSLKMINRAVTGERWEEVEIEIKRKDGNARIVLWNSANIMDRDNKTVAATIAQGLDITERKKTEEELRESENKFRQTFDLSPVGIVMVGLDKQFIRCNNAFSSSLGYEADEFIRKTISEVTHPDDIQIGISDMGAIIRGEIETSQIQKRYIGKNGNLIWGETLISLVRDNSGNPNYFLAIIQDITERKLAEEEIKTKVAELERFNRLSVGRELRMVELKQEINELCGKLKMPLRYKSGNGQ